ncbi:Uncharacterized protein TPAR_01743 [Tolypocladium paradoxum]|uniref:Uncharacterized protein n=1 Tax=Tolypocladium paradoxum TaxID=94208 RepID=A0A2S4L6K9_9HYPO|nr:Uncharacterized protein TPAR_01743 [Tolypocladium paradoxum]
MQINVVPLDEQVPGVFQGNAEEIRHVTPIAARRQSSLPYGGVHLETRQVRGRPGPTAGRSQYEDSGCAAWSRSPSTSSSQSSRYCSMAHIQQSETADEYGRRSKCLRDHRKRPFCFRDHVSYIHATVHETGSNGLVEQPGLQVCSIPRPTIDLDASVDEREDLLDYWCTSTSFLSRIPPVFPQWRAIKDLLVPLGDLDLGSALGMDAREYFSEVSSKQSCHIPGTWLPLSPVKAERDEGLTFPLKSRKLHSLLQRELEQEGIESSEGAEDFEEDGASTHIMYPCSSVPHASIGLGQPRRNYVEVITPPLSPISDAASPFIPEAEVTLIDLTSEPNSPVARETLQLQSSVRAGRIDSDIVTSSSTARSSPPMFDKVSGTKHPATQDIILDVPIILMSSDPMAERDVFANIEISTCVDVEELLPTVNANESYFEDALKDILVDRQVHATSLVEQEWLNPSDSISRVPVPVLNFELPKSDWFNKGWSSREHLSWLQTNMSATYHMPKIPRDARLESSLRWMPIPRGSGVVQVVDKLEVGTGTREYLTVEGPLPPAGSARYFSVSQKLAIIDLKDDDEIEELESVESTSNDTLSHDSGVTATNEHMPSERRQSSSTRETDLQSLCRSLRRKAVDDGYIILPRSKDASATSTLLAGFMDLRAVKRPRICPPGDSAADTSTEKLVKAPLPAMKNQPPLVHEPEQDLVPAPAPDINIPEEKGPCIISLTLERSIVRQLEMSWPADMLLDRDYSQHDTMAWSPGTVLPKKVVSPLTFEADISLSPSTGVITTTLLKVKQKPLPGSKAQTPLRERVQRISHKYESLVVLVSGSNPAGEFVGSFGSSDMAAYADFVRFTAALDGEVKAYLVPGSNKTLSQWILSLMCRHSTQSVALARFISAEETTWEVFLRRAGMNVVAAQVLSKTLLEEFGNAGLAQFLVMPPHTRVSKYGQLLGGQRVLLRCCEGLDRGWA